MVGLAFGSLNSILRLVLPDSWPDLLKTRGAVDKLVAVKVLPPTIG